MSKSKAGATKRKAAALPKGYTLARTSLDGFFAREEGNSITGVLRGSFKVTGKFGVKTIYRIAITEGETQVGEGEMVGPGGIVGLDETGYTSVLGDLEMGTGVYVRYEGLANPDAAASKENPHVFTVARAE